MLIAAVLLGLSLSGCNSRVVIHTSDGPATGVATTTAVTGNGVLRRQQRNVTPFSKVQIDGPFDVAIAAQTDPGLTVEADENILSVIRTEVSGDTLRVYTVIGVNAGHPMKATIGVKALDGVSLMGSGSVKATGVQSEDFTLELTGSGEIEAAGSAKLAHIRLTGSGSIKADALKADATVTEIAGSGNAEVFAQNHLSASVSGSGNVRYSGSPTIDKKEIAGSGSIEPR